MSGGDWPGKTKVADPDLALAIDEEVARLYISVHHIGAVEIFE